MVDLFNSDDPGQREDREPSLKLLAVMVGVVAVPAVAASAI